METYSYEEMIRVYVYIICEYIGEYNAALLSFFHLVNDNIPDKGKVFSLLALVPAGLKNKKVGNLI